LYLYGGYLYYNFKISNIFLFPGPLKSSKVPSDDFKGEIC
jgi:hypothetical protein